MEVKMASLLHVLVALLYLIECSGVTHWRIKHETIQPVNGNTVITDRLPVCNNEETTMTSCDNGDSVSVYDRELAIIIKGLQISKKAPWAPVSQVTSSIGSKCPPGGKGAEKPLTLKISDPKNPSNNRCHVARKTTTAPVEPHKKAPRYTSTSTPIQDLTCESVDFTIYDFLKGIALRTQLPPHPEPEVAIVFRSSDTITTIDMFEVEASLVLAVKEGPLTCDLLGKIANYWRVKGDTFKAIECFRQALSINADDPETLLNLARLLYNHHYYDNVVFLTRKSLHVTDSNDISSWKHYFLLAETYKKLKKYEEAVEFYKKTLEINPGLHTAEVQLRELGKPTMDTVTNTYTIVIISTLVTGVLAIIYHLMCTTTTTK